VPTCSGQYFVKSIRTVTTQDQSQKAKRDNCKVHARAIFGRLRDINKFAAILKCAYIFYIFLTMST
jgi:hypothetical protein